MTSYQTQFGVHPVKGSGLGLHGLTRVKLGKLEKNI
jgi:hypothetical protein